MRRWASARRSCGASARARARKWRRASSTAWSPTSRSSSAHYFGTGEQPLRTGNDHGLVAPYGLFDAKDGQVAIAPSNDMVYFKLLDALGPVAPARPSRLRHQRRALRAARCDQRARQRSRSASSPSSTGSTCSMRPACPCGRVMSLPEVFEDPQIRHQQMQITIDHPVHGKLDVLGFPIKFTEGPVRRASAAAGAGRGYRRRAARARVQPRGDRLAARASHRIRNGHGLRHPQTGARPRVASPKSARATASSPKSDSSTPRSRRRSSTR